MANAFDRAVVQIAVRHFQRTRQIILGDREAVILRRDFDSLRSEILHGWFAPRWPNFSLNVRAPQASDKS